MKLFLTLILIACIEHNSFTSALGGNGASNALLPAVTTYDPNPTCRPISDAYTRQGFYMVDKCGAAGEFDPNLQSLCEEEWKGDDDIRKIVPVTSLSSSLTYKNYFCLRCHEPADQFLFWDVQLLIHRTGFGMVPNHGDLSLAYDYDRDSWLGMGADGSIVPGEVTFTIPGDIRHLAAPCDPDVVSQCSDYWPDEYDRVLCDAYTDIVYVSRGGLVVRYKNEHCARCNFELEVYVIRAPPAVPDVAPVVRAVVSTSLDTLFNANINRCAAGEEYVGTRCRRIGCIVPGYVIRNGRCVPPEQSLFA